MVQGGDLISKLWLEGRVLTWAIWSNLPKSWLSVSTNSEAVSFSDNGVKLTMSAYKMLKKEKKKSGIKVFKDVSTKARW